MVKSPGFAALWGCGVSPSTSAADEWALTNGSEYIACGIMAGVTGKDLAQSGDLTRRVGAIRAAAPVPVVIADTSETAVA